jgi:hypothetical protein
MVLGSCDAGEAEELRRRGQLRHIHRRGLAQHGQLETARVREWKKGTNRSMETYINSVIRRLGMFLVSSCFDEL